jgi:hypothetical protein
MRSRPIGRRAMRSHQAFVLLDRIGLQEKRPWHARDDCQGLGQTACQDESLCKPDYPTFGAQWPAPGGSDR